MKNSVLLEDALLLIEQNFYFLHGGEFFGDISKREDFSQSNFNIKRKFDTNQTYSFNGAIIKEILKDAHETPQEDITLFEYFVEFSAFRGICMAMVEALRIQSNFKSFMEERLSDQYEDFFDIISFVRNVLSHNIHAQIKLNEKDYAGTLKRIRRMKRDSNILFNLIYARDLPEIGAPDFNYGVTCSVDFSSLEENMPFLDIISHWELMMLSELCFNFVMSYKMHEDGNI
ncbi:MAG: hypothetical protein PF437_09065 [Sulfurimonas sp.]|nr:hypothetical protein [Sulfurimonas sp.]